MAEMECAVCKHKIEGRILSAMGKTFHPDHFTCSTCKQPITDDKFQLHENEPVCDSCFEKNYMKYCEACKEPIRAKIIRAMNAYWHEEHFVCTVCKSVLNGKSFMTKDEKPYCEFDYHEQFSVRCKGCSKPITDRAIIAINEKWHQNCFVCKKCQQPIIEDTFQVDDGEPICVQCTK